jgi:protein ImuA
MSNRRQILETLQQRVHDLQANHCPWGEVVSTGCRELDGLLGEGIEQGSIVEWIGTAGAGATTLAFAVARAACQEQGVLVVVDEKRMFYPPAAQALGINLDQTIVVQPTNKQDYQWSLIQILRCPGVSAVVCWPEKASERMLRRMQIAAERGGALGFLIRPPGALHEPSWARYRLLVEARCSPDQSRRWRVTLIRGQTQQHAVIELEMNHETGNLQACPLSVAPSMVPPTALQGAS